MFSLPVRSVPVQKIGDWLAASGDLQALARVAQRLKRIEHLLFEAVPPELASACRVGSLKAGTLVVSADNAAVAAKLRQLAPRLLLHLRNCQIQITGIRVDVQVKARQIKDEDDVTALGLPPEAIHEFSVLSRRLPSSPLQQALARLASRRARRR